jgi:hypothetical protein
MKAPRDDCFGQFRVRVICDCGACREIEPEALAPRRLVGDTKGVGAADALLELREEGCRGGGRCEAEASGSSQESTLIAPPATGATSALAIWQCWTTPTA